MFPFILLNRVDITEIKIWIFNLITLWSNLLAVRRRQAHQIRRFRLFFEYHAVDLMYWYADSAISLKLFYIFDYSLTSFCLSLDLPLLELDNMLLFLVDFLYFNRLLLFLVTVRVEELRFDLLFDVITNQALFAF